MVKRYTALNLVSVGFFTELLGFQEKRWNVRFIKSRFIKFATRRWNILRDSIKHMLAMMVKYPSTLLSQIQNGISDIKIEIIDEYIKLFLRLSYSKHQLPYHDHQ